jgi:glycosyltransferase involved in cell wall biosynthesis
VRVLIFHGYLLEGTGSNVYNARLAQALVDLGHEVHLLCQDRHPERHRFEGAGSCTLYRPDIGGLLPVYVADRYEGIEARPFADCSEAEVAFYIAANVAAVCDVVKRVQPEVALANHLIMGPVILARALGGRVPYAVKVHGSALEYTVKPNPERFLGFAREGLAAADGVLVGSRHTAESLWAAIGDQGLPARTRLGPPGVDVHGFRPRERAQALAGVQRLKARLGANRQTADEGTVDKGTVDEGTFARDDAAAAAALGRIDLQHDRLVVFVGKLIANKGVDLLLEAWPLVLAREPAARLLIVGFGEERERLQAAAAPLGERVLFTGRLDHEELTELLPACEALVMPSIFPEAFGMVAAEAAACGVFPISAAHSGMAEVSNALAQRVPKGVVPWLSFAIDDRAVETLAACLIGWLQVDSRLRAQTRAGLVETVRERWSWEGVAHGVLAAGLGELDGLAKP